MCLNLQTRHQTNGNQTKQTKQFKRWLCRVFNQLLVITFDYISNQFFCRSVPLPVPPLLLFSIVLLIM